MAEIDYQMALLLQHEEQTCSKDAELLDQELARQLQEQFEREEAENKPPPGLVYKPPKRDHNSSRSLVDPSWELVDPTPDIHNLFIVFNERFFWNKLLAVCVSWSKRMTSCAGICSYQPRAGMCSITLSEPLLKLRPRKDLVETLLHEMIHAYLFITHNNRDRDGHGPEFHSHMYRINKEAGTNITVYHDFHDEVRLYKQHWWRCNGPCQHWKPYFGMVRRATNRAPGPNDRWWGEHYRSCGGIFIKVKEPEKKLKPEKKSDGKNLNKINNKENSSKIINNKDIRNFFVPKENTASSNNIKGFKDLTNNVKGKYNSSSTIVVSKNTSTNTDSTYKPTIFNSNKTSSTGSTKKNVPTNSVIPETYSVDTYSNEFLSVRNHWANKFKTPIKRPSVETPTTASKIPRVSDCPEEYCDCPVCNKKVVIVDLNSHLDICLLQSESDSSKLPTEEMKECPICSNKIVASLFDAHVAKCLTQFYDEIEEKLENTNSKETVDCLACGKKILKIDLNSHLDDCMVDIFDVEFDDCDKKEKMQKTEKQSDFNCPFCMELVEEKEMKKHIDICLQSEGCAVAKSLIDDF